MTTFIDLLCHLLLDFEGGWILQRIDDFYCAFNNSRHPGIYGVTLMLVREENRLVNTPSRQLLNRLWFKTGSFHYVGDYKEGTQGI